LSNTPTTMSRTRAV